MATINELLDKYFQGQTSIAEENELKEYFGSDKVSEEHKPYETMFSNFLQESQITNPSKPVLHYEPAHIIRKNKLRIWIASASGIAATVLVALWLFGTQTPKDDYAVINGKVIENEQVVQKLAQARLSKVNRMLARNLEPLKSIERVHENLEPIRKVSNISDKMNK